MGEVGSCLTRRWRSPAASSCRVAVRSGRVFCPCRSSTWRPIERDEIVAADAGGGDVAASCGVAPEQDLLTRENHREAVGKRLQKGDVLPTLSVEVASLSSIALAQSLGITDPEDGPSCAVPELCGPCLRPAVGACSDRTPLSWREKLFPEDLDREDPDRQDIWQFMNVRVLQGGDPPATWAGWNLSERT